MNPSSDLSQNTPSPGFAGGSERVSRTSAAVAGVRGGAAKILPYTPRLSLGTQINTLREHGFLDFQPQGIFYGARRRPFPLRFGSSLSAALIDQWSLEVSGIYEVHVGPSGLPFFAVISCDITEPWDDGEPEEVPCEWEPCRPLRRDGAGIVGRCQCDRLVTLVPSASGGWKVDH